MSNTAHTIARAHRAGHVAMLATGHRAAWQATMPIAAEMFASKPNFGAAGTAYVTNPKGNRAWGPPSA